MACAFLSASWNVSTKVGRSLLSTMANTIEPDLLQSLICLNHWNPWHAENRHLARHGPAT